MNIRRVIGVVVVLVILGIGFYFLFQLLFPEREVPGSQPGPESGAVDVGGGFGVPPVNVIQPNRLVNVFDPTRDDRDDRVPFIIQPTPPIGGTGEGVDTPTSTPSETPRLIRLYRGPTAGYRIEISGDEYVVQVVEKGRGDRYLINTNPYSLNRVGSGEFFKVFEGHVFENGDALLLFENPTNEFAVDSAFVSFNTTTGGTGTRLFEKNIRVATDGGNNLFFIKPTETGSLGFTLNVENEDSRVVWESGVRLWQPKWGKNDVLSVYTPTSYNTKQYYYTVDLKNRNEVNKISSDERAEGVFFDDTSNFILRYKGGVGGRVSSATVGDIFDNDVTEVLISFPEKCDALNGIFICAAPIEFPEETLLKYEARYPDSWYQGDVVFNDGIFVFDATIKQRDVLLNPNDGEIRRLSGGQTFDVVNLKISPDGQFVFFVNKADGSLWMLRINS